jgi:hypothetical protein
MAHALGQAAAFMYKQNDGAFRKARNIARAS